MSMSLRVYTVNPSTGERRVIVPLKVYTDRSPVAGIGSLCGCPSCRDKPKGERVRVV